ncbi:MAG: serine/threonine-protein kinase, partial [Acidobacteriota bacterium]
MSKYHDRLESLFHEIADLAPRARAERLRAVEKDAPGLAAELAKLLAHDATEEGAPEPAAGRPATHGPGTVIGSYRLEEILGEGGMGVVWRAEQTEPVRRHVALKLLERHRMSDSMTRRFDAERQALASLDHPNIASLLDSGATERGEPWFAMELIDGLPITDYCDRAAASLARRLELFESLCDAVQHAHRRGLIHRDLKPSNVIVDHRDGGAEDGAPRLRVIDFGIAKFLPLADAPTGVFETLGGDVIGTPEYMSPEQAGYADSVVDTRTDVYALGVLLYELLVGELPISPQTLRRAGLDEMRRVIREEDAPKPSSRLTTGAQERTAEIARQRATRPADLIRHVSGELDWIVLKAIAKSKVERYETPLALAADLRRYVGGDPVEAGPPSWRYRVGKWARKHRAATSAIGGALALVSLSAVLITAALLRAQAAEREALQEAAQERATRAFLVELFEANDPFARDPWTGAEARPRTITGDEILDRGARRLAAIEDPVTRSRLQLTVGELYLQMARDDAAAPLIEGALASFRGSGASDAGDDGDGRAR